MSKRSCVVTLHDDGSTSHCSHGKARQLLNDARAVVTERGPGGKVTVIRVAQRYGDLNQEWRSKKSGYAGPQVLQLTPVQDRRHSAGEYAQEDTCEYE